MLPVSSSQSTKYGVAPTYRIALTVAANVNVETGTTSPGPTPHDTRARWRAAVPEERPTACARTGALGHLLLEGGQVRPGRRDPPGLHGPQDVLLLELADIGWRQQHRQPTTGHR